MNRTWSFYNSKTGEFHPRRYSAPNDKDLQSAIPLGCVAIEGSFDRLAQKFDSEKGAVVDWLNVEAVAKAERLAQVANARRRIAELEASQPRAVREHSLRPNEKGADDKTPLDRLQAIDQEIAALRQVIAGTDTSAPSARRP